MKEIVVGVDGSNESKDAFRFALREARAHRARVVAASTWHTPSSVYAGGVPVPVMELGEEVEIETRNMLDAVIAERAADADGLEIDRVVRQGNAAEILVELARDADLLVVGSRGRGGFAGLVLGSVSQQCAHHAKCPVTIVPRGRETAY
jgi:nucleotide-binding universal stress UspA family protein